MTVGGSGSPTKKLFDILKRLFGESRDLLLDSDRLLADRGWRPIAAPPFAELSYTLDSPHKWFPRWAGRCYLPESGNDTDSELPTVDYVLFISVHFAADEGTSKVDEPEVAAGFLRFKQKLTQTRASKAWQGNYWLCKSPFWGNQIADPPHWQEWDPSKYVREGRYTRGFRVPLYSIKSSVLLEQLVIAPLLSGLPGGTD